MATMSKIISSAAKLLAANTIIKEADPVAFLTKSTYSTKSEATFEIKPNKLHKLDKGPATTTKITSAQALKIYEEFVVSRRMETAANALYKAKHIRGFCHLYTGQEAVAIGMKTAMRDQDSVITSYRCHTWTYLMGATVLGVLAELTGRVSGVSRGKGGSMHMYAKNFHGGNGIVGAQVPLGAGVALGHKYSGDGGVNFAMYGDGASNQGQVFEAYNIAKLWSLPCVFVCENNKYGMGTADKRSSASTDYYSRGDYIPGLLVDGMNVFACIEATRFCIDYCTSGKGPLVMEMETYRYYGHSMSDPGTSYRSRDEIQKMRKSRDPINFFKEQILNSKLVTADQLKEVDNRIKKMVDKAAEQSKSDAVVGLEELCADIYFKNLHTKGIRGTLPTTRHKHLDVAPRK